jgi:hypothetical protein
MAATLFSIPHFVIPYCDHNDDIGVVCSSTGKFDLLRNYIIQNIFFLKKLWRIFSTDQYHNDAMKFLTTTIPFGITLCFSKTSSIFLFRHTLNN